MHIPLITGHVQSTIFHQHVGQIKSHNPSDRISTIYKIHTWSPSEEATSVTTGSKGVYRQHPVSQLQQVVAPDCKSFMKLLS